jgi:hypothetical protein
MNLLTAEETSVLRYLQGCPTATVVELDRACLPGGSIGWVDRVALNLDWFGFVVAYHGSDSQVAALQITDRGRRAVVSNLLAESVARRPG